MNSLVQIKFIYFKPYEILICRKYANLIMPNTMLTMHFINIQSITSFRLITYHQSNIRFIMIIISLVIHSYSLYPTHWILILLINYALSLNDSSFITYSSVVIIINISINIMHKLFSVFIQSTH